MAAVMNARGREIINILLQSNDYLKVDEIARQINISKRSIYYDIYQINDWLNYYGLPELAIIRKKGILITEDVKAEIEGILEDDSLMDDYVFSPTERIGIIICSIIYSDEPV